MGFVGLPCVHIRPFIGGWMDGSLAGWIRWLVGQHIRRCHNCQKALAALTALRERLRRLGQASLETPETLEPARWDDLEAAWSEVEKKKTG